MGVCASLCPRSPDSKADPFSSRDDVTSLIRTENLTSEAIRKAIPPPAPLLKEISFAAIAMDEPEPEEEEESSHEPQNPETN
jgi:hypothetical protein